MAIRNEIVRGFRNRTGNYLLVLTDDYDRLDFVLVERYTQAITTQDETYEVQTLFPGKAPVLVRPRVLQVMRRDPGDVAMRVLRRFTYTEGVPFSLCGKSGQTSTNFKARRRYPQFSTYVRILSLFTKKT